jgi:tRNA A37 N6-isopentenylltransferase MiaA
MDISSEKLDLSSEEAHVKTRKILLDSIESQFVTFAQVQTSEHDTTRKRIREESDATRQFEESEHKKTRTVLSSEMHQNSEEKLIRQVELTILRSLRFETMHHRSDAIKEEYARTFEWIFHDPDNMAGSGSDPGTNLELVTESDAIVARPTEEHPPRQWSNFAQWLRSGNDIY